MAPLATVDELVTSGGSGCGDCAGCVCVLVCQSRMLACQTVRQQSDGTDLRNRQEGQTFCCFEVDDRVVLGIGHADPVPT